MAGPEQISDPRFKQFTEAVEPDTSTGDLIEGLTQVGLEGLELHQTGSLRKEIQAKRKEFLEAVDRGASGASIHDVSGDDEDDVGLTLNTEDVLRNVDTSKVTVNVTEIANMEGEIAAKVRANRQGITPIRALEVDVEAITRRYIDRFPGLAPQFQRVAQTALGTSNNLLSATMRAQEELFAQAENLANNEVEQFNRLREDAADAGFVQAIYGPTIESQAQAITQFMVLKQKEAEAALFKANEEAAAARGEVGKAQQMFNARLSTAQKVAMRGVSSAVIRALPEQYRDRGASGIIAYVNENRNNPDAMASLQRSLEAAQSAIRFQIGQSLRTSGHITESQRLAVEELQDMADAQMSVLVDVASNKRVSEEAKYQLQILKDANEFEFETVFGRPALLTQKFLQFLPVDNNLWNLWKRNEWTQGFAEDMIKFYNKGDITTRALGAGSAGSDIDVTTGDGKALVRAVDKAAVNAFAEFLNDPVAAVASDYNAQDALAGFNHNFNRMDPKEKRALLEVIGSDKWDAIADVPEVAALADKVTQWGHVKLEDAKRDFINDLGGTEMVNKWKIKIDTSLSDGKPLPGIAGMVKAGHRPIKVADLVTMKQTNAGISFGSKTVGELSSIGIDTSPENIANIQRMIASLNSIHGAGLNAYARAMGNLGTGSSREQILTDFINELIGPQEDADVQ